MHALVWPHSALVSVSRTLSATYSTKVRLPWRISTSTLNAQHRHFTPHPTSFSSIAEAMLGRAVQKYQPAPKRDTNQIPSNTPTSTPKIEDALKKKTPSSQSIGGFTNATNRGTALRSLSPNARMASKPQKAGLGRTISSADSNLAAVLEKGDSFQDIQDEIAPSHSANTHRTPAFDSNDWLDDFPDDADIDLDLDESPPAPPVNIRSFKYYPPPAQKPATTPPLPKLPPPNRTNEITSSAQSWSSSSPSHKVTPPGAKRQHNGHSIFDKNKVPSEDALDANPRPAKRRTLPWVAKKSEEDAQKKAANVEEFTPLPKDSKNRSLPWNTSLSAVKDQQKSYKNQRKHLQRKADATADEMAAAAAESRKIISSRAQFSPISLNEEQKKILQLVTEKKKSVFFTGSAGTGKSVLMRSIIDFLKRKYAKDPERVCVTASTGLAACNIGGQTLHSFSGIGLGKEDVPTLVKKIRKNAKSKNRWIKCQVLIIDEISMVDGDLFDKLENIARILRNNGRPFGGIQLIVTGDFFQLPPVPDHGKANVKFSFEAATWRTVIDHTIGLTQVFRQKDPVFANMLNEMRMGTISDETVKLFKSLSRPIREGVATELFPTRNEVDNSNSMRLRNLIGKEYVYDATDGGTLTTTDMAQREKLLSNMMAPKSIRLKKGAQVMLIKNVDDSLVNGSLGHVVGFMSEATFNLYDDDPEAFEDDYMEEEGLSGREKKHREELKAKIEMSKGDGSQKLLPLVKFKLADGTSRDMLMQEEDWKVELPSGQVLASRKQLPLILAWALSIHKAQGQTLEFVKVDLGKVFEKGQAYVALSRATHQEGLQVLNFDKRKVMAHPTVIKFYRDLYGVDQVEKRTTASASTLVAKPSGASVKKDSKMVVEKKATKEVKREVKKQDEFMPDEEEEEELMRMNGWG